MQTRQRADGTFDNNFGIAAILRASQISTKHWGFTGTTPSQFHASIHGGCMRKWQQQLRDNG